MFKFLKNKLKGAVENIAKNVKKEEIQEEPEQKKEFPKSEQKKKTEKQETKKEQKQPEKKEEAPEPATKKLEEKETIKESEEKIEPEKKKKSFLNTFTKKVTEKVTTIQLSEEKFEELFWDLELALLENNVAVEIIDKIKMNLKEELTTGRTARGGLQERITNTLLSTIEEVLDNPPYNLLEETKKHQPLIIAIVGINGSGKTTTIAKLTKKFQDNKKTVVLAAADTFRAAAIQQLEEHANNLGTTIIKQDYGADPAAVAYDAISHATANNKDVVIIDTAGRLHSNTNLMEELEKVIRVSKPHHIIFVGEAITGNDCVEQARKFSEQLAVDGIILSKADVDEKGGAAISISHVTGKPILYIGTGQGYDDLKPFNKKYVLEQLTT